MIKKAEAVFILFKFNKINEINSNIADMNTIVI